MDTTPHRARSRILTGAGLAAVAALVLAGCSDDPARTLEGTATPPAGQLRPGGETTDVATGLDAPWSVVRTGDGGDALVSERDSAQVLELDGSGKTRTVGTVDGVSHGGEGGLLGLALHDGDLFVYSTAEDGNRIQQAGYARQASPARIKRQKWPILPVAVCPAAQLW